MVGNLQDGNGMPGSATLILVSIDHDGRTPVYLQLAAILREGIERGDYQVGRKLPSETTLLQQYGLARGTIRKAMRLLADEGLAEVIQGRGVFVAERPE
jgi:GntR family transcriptional regulator